VGNEHPERAVLFDTAAGRYDQHRPGYPPEIIGELMELAMITPRSRVLEVGCGTGKATVSVAAAGCSIDCVDPGGNLVSIARQNCAQWPGVRFVIGRFEEIVLESHAYDLVYSAQAFHWTDPLTRWRRCAECLAHGGSVALVNNYSIAPVTGPGRDISAMVEHETGGAMKPWAHVAAVEEWTKEMDATGLFGPVQVRRHRWTRRRTAEQYVGLFGTYSDFLSLSPAVQDRVSQGIRDVLARHDGWIDHSYETVLLHAKVADGQGG
jgi:SAM-dependent methyltransferase